MDLGHMIVAVAGLVKVAEAPRKGAQVSGYAPGGTCLAGDMIAPWVDDASG